MTVADAFPLANVVISEGFCPRCSTPLAPASGLCSCCDWAWRLLSKEDAWPYSSNKLVAILIGWAYSLHHTVIHLSITLPLGWVCSHPVDQEYVTCPHRHRPLLTAPQAPT